MNYAGYFNTVAATAIVRISYNGTCSPPIDPSIGISNRALRAGGPAEFQGSRIRALASGAIVKVTDTRGRLLLERGMAAGTELDLSEALPGLGGLLAVSVTAGAGSLSRMVLLGAR
jgi:hypothetical protein